MQKTVLYRKYRPQKFSEVLGQEHIVSVLTEVVKSGAPAHAYLFTGSRGTGKTSVARIFAREIGCLPEDLYEIDAASNRGIDDVRELRDSVKSMPFSSPYKVYIVDEVHMLTTPAFNALLKTLEEPPSHVIFILATTDLEKLPDTVISRCQTFRFKKPAHSLLSKMITTLAKKEGFSLEPTATELVALLGDGSFRDTQGVLQHILGAAGKDKNITRVFVEHITDAPSGALVRELVDALAEKDLAKGLSVVSRLSDTNANFTLFGKLFLDKLRLVLLLRYAPDMEKKVAEELSSDDLIYYKMLAKEKTKEINSRTLLEMINAQVALSRVHRPQVSLELALINLLAVDNNT